MRFFRALRIVLRGLRKALKTYSGALTGPRKDEVWKGVAAEIGAKFIEAGPWGGSKVQLHEGDWIITLETYQTDGGDFPLTYACLRSYFHRAGISVDGVRSLFSSSTEIRRLVSVWKQANVAISIYHLRPDGAPFHSDVSELFMDMRSIPKDPALIKHRFKLFLKILNLLDREIRDSQDEVDRLLAILRAPGGKIERKGLVYWDGDPPRNRAADELIHLRDVRAVPVFLSTLDDSDPRLHGKSIIALGELGDRQAVPALIPLLGDRRPAGARSAAGYAADALRKLGGEGIVAAFDAGLAGEMEGLKEVAHTYRRPAIEALLNLVRISIISGPAAARVLVELGATEALPALRSEAQRLGKTAAARVGLPGAIADLEARASLPRPASAPVPSTDTLPRAAAEPGPDTATLPRALDEPDPAS